MPKKKYRGKQTLNLNDFSGGIVKSKNPRDLADSEFAASDGLLSPFKGELKIVGGFETPVSLTSCEGGYQHEGIADGVRNLWSIQPEYGFRQIIYVQATSISSDEVTFTSKGKSSLHSDDLTNMDHGLTSGVRVAIVKSEVSTDPNFNFYERIEYVDSVSFKISRGTNDGLVNGRKYLLVIEATYDENGKYLSTYAPATMSPSNNNYLLKSTSGGIFGFYNIGPTGGWYGGNPDHLNRGIWGWNGEDPWLFDIQYLWDWQQKGGENSIPFRKNEVIDAFYDNGMFRVMIKPPEEWLFGHCRRPVSFVHINEDFHLHMDDDRINTKRIREGWYPLRSHILSCVEYKSYAGGFGNTILNYDEVGYGVPNDYDDTVYCGSSSIDDISNSNLEFKSSLLMKMTQSGNIFSLKWIPNNFPYRFHVMVGTGDEASVEGDWQFKTGDHRQIGLGISLIYDDIEFVRQSESMINYLNSIGDNTNTNYSHLNMKDIDNIEDNRSLNLSFVVPRGFHATHLQANEQVSSNMNVTDKRFGGPHGGEYIPEVRGSGTGNSYSKGFSNYALWNPRVKGANIWLVLDENGLIDDPLWLATIDFDSHSRSVSHDGVESSKWDTFRTNETSIQTIVKIKSVPTITYKVKNGYSYKTVTSAWYQTAAIVNRRLYAGNVSYFDPTDSFHNRIHRIDEKQKITHKPDRILVSPVNKFDLLPITSYIDVIAEDGQDIVELIGFGQKLLVFKHNDMYVVDASGEFEFLEKSHKGYGVWNKTMVTQTSNYVFWLNARGVYAYGQDGNIVDVITDTLGLEEWKKYYSDTAHLSYDPEKELLLIHCKSSTDNFMDRRLLIVDIATGSVFYKSRPSNKVEKYHSTGINVNNTLYLTAGDGADNIDDFDIYPQTDHVVPTFSEGKISFKLGTGDSAVNKNAPSANVIYILVRKASAWVCLNASTPLDNTVAISDSNRAAEYFINQANQKCSDNSNYDIHFDYDSDSELFSAHVKAKAVGTGYNGTAVDLSGGNGAEFGTSSIVFSSTNATDGGGIHDGNISDYTFEGLDDGVNAVAGVFRVSVDRNSTSNIDGIMYTMKVIISKGNQDTTSEHVSLTGTYITGQSSLNETRTSGFSYEDEDSGSTIANKNDALITNIREYFFANPMKDQFGYDVMLSEYFSFGALAGSSGAKYFDLTALSNNDTITNSDDIFIDGETYAPSGGSIYQWSNVTTAIQNKVLLETKDFDFGQPNVRKKIYKAYITYTGGKRVKVWYKVDQGASWVAATTTGTSVASHLDVATNFTRQEITFGTGGNNVYSFALKFQNSLLTSDFVINDITFIYREKSTK